MDTSPQDNWTTMKFKEDDSQFKTILTLSVFLWRLQKLRRLLKVIRLKFHECRWKDIHRNFTVYTNSN